MELPLGVDLTVHSPLVATVYVCSSDCMFSLQASARTLAEPTMSLQFSM